MSIEENRFMTWRIRVADISSAGAQGSRQATAEEASAMVEMLDLEALSDFHCWYALKPLGRDRVRVSGKLSALIAQICVVTLKPFDHRVEIKFSVDLWPQHQLKDQIDSAILDQPCDVDQQPEPYENDRIDLGVLFFDYLALSLDPHPRKPDVSFKEDNDHYSSVEAGPENPFAVLKDLNPND